MCVPDAVKGPLLGVTKSIGWARQIRTPYALAAATQRRPSSPSGSGTCALAHFLPKILRSRSGMELYDSRREMTFLERYDTLNAVKKIGTWGKPE